MEKTKSKKLSIKKILIIIGVCLVLGLFLIYQNKHLVITYYYYHTDKIDGNDSITIVQLSDLHNDSFGKDNGRIVQMVRELNPDIIVITGDLVDSYRTNVDVALTLVNQLTDICSVYYITGNHEMWLEDGAMQTLFSGLRDAGVYILSNEVAKLVINGNPLYLAGLNEYNLYDETLKNMLSDTDEDILNIVLAHEPQHLEKYANNGADLVLSGHAHGGQFRLPFIGGLYAPDQGFLPEYTSGEYIYNDTVMFVSRGLGNSTFPFRLFNYPEIVCIVID